MELYKESDRNYAEDEKNEDSLKIKEYLHNVFIKNNNGNDRIEQILRELRPTIENEYFKKKFSKEIDSEELLKNLSDCAGIESEEEFIEKIYSLIKILLDIKRKYPKEYEKVLRESFIEKFNKINEILSYGKDGDTIHIHIAPVETMGVKEKINYFKDGLKDLAKIVKAEEKDKNNQILTKKIIGTSWIIAEKPRLIERFGFINAGEIDDEIKDLHFRNEQEKVGWAYMERDDFLKKYLSE
jgi:hypothetical protein